VKTSKVQARQMQLSITMAAIFDIGSHYIQGATRPHCQALCAGWRIFKMDTIVDFQPPWSIPVPLYIKFSLQGGVITVSCVGNQIGVSIWFVCPSHWLHPDELGHM